MKYLLNLIRNFKKICQNINLCSLSSYSSGQLDISGHYCHTFCVNRTAIESMIKLL